MMGPNKFLVDMQANKELESAKNAALAASKTEWDGEGLPPAGCECEARYRYSSVAEWVFFRCVAVDCEVAFGWTEKKPVTLLKDNFEFRPVRSEADKNRDLIISKIEKAYKDCPHSDAVPQAIYEAIAEHIRID